jgi:hypothetical protein
VKIDGHVHFVGDGSNGSECWLRCSSLLDQIIEPVVKAQAGILQASRKLGIDQAYEEKLIELIDQSSLDAVLLLAMDYPYDSDGNCLKEKAKFYVPNDHVINLAHKYSQVLPACSIHPARTDAIEELERCAEQGAKVLKLPQCRLYRYTLQKLLGKTLSLGTPFPCPHRGRILRPRSECEICRSPHTPLTLGMRSPSNRCPRCWKIGSLGSRLYK